MRLRAKTPQAPCKRFAILWEGIMNETLTTVFGLLGGLALFIYGMNLMSENLQKIAGDRMRAVLGLLTKNPVLGVLAGAVATAVMQSSSATTVMVIGFVSAGLMGLPQAISIILGANIGTTITAQIIAFKITDFIPVFIFAGFLVYFVAKKAFAKNLGLSILAFGLLFLGIDTMSDAMKPLASSPVFLDMIANVSEIPVLGVAVGTLMTVVVQSSSATIAVLQNFASQPAADGVSSIIGLQGAIPILLGDNIGTTITALLASIGQSRNAKRVAVSHCLFNISGALLFIWFIPQYAAFIAAISPAGPEVEVISRQIANAHTAFNCIMTLIWLPLIPLMVKIVTAVLPESKQVETVDARAQLGIPVFLEERLISQPTVAMRMVAQEVMRCGDGIRDVLGRIARIAREGSPTREQLEDLGVRAQAACDLSEKTSEYLTEVFAAGVLNEEQASGAAGVLRVLNDQNRIGGQCVEVAKTLDGSFTQEAMNDLASAFEAVESMYADVMSVSLGTEDGDIEEILRLKGDVLDLDIKIRKAHMKRVAAGECTPESKAAFVSVLNNVDRIANNCVNIADAVARGEVDLGHFLLEGDVEAHEVSERSIVEAMTALPSREGKR